MTSPEGSNPEKKPPTVHFPKQLGNEHPTGKLRPRFRLYNSNLLQLNTVPLLSRGNQLIDLSLCKSCTHTLPPLRGHNS